MSGIDPATLPDALRLNWARGRRRGCPSSAGGGAIVKRTSPRTRRLKVGDTLTLTTPTRAKLELPITGVVKDDGGLIADIAVPLARWRARSTSARTPSGWWA